MKKLVYTCNILSALPATLVVPLLPFVFILIEGQGEIPGLLHENLVKILMFVYPVALIICVVLAIRLMRADKVGPALWFSLVPLGVFLLLCGVFIGGGVNLR